MNQDIAYNVLSFLDNPQQYQRVSRSFKEVSEIAQKEYIQYLKNTYPLMLISPKEMIKSWDGRYHRIDVATVKRLIVLYLNEMALDGKWERLWLSLQLIDRDLLPDPNTVVDMIHINGNDDFAFCVYMYLSKRLCKDPQSLYKDYIWRYYEFYRDPTSIPMTSFHHFGEKLGYIPKGVIEYFDANPDMQDINMMGAIVQRTMFTIKDESGYSQPTVTSEFHDYEFRRISMALLDIMSIVRDYPDEDMYELCIRLGVEKYKSDISYLLTKNRETYNSRMLDFIHDATIGRYHGPVSKSVAAVTFEQHRSIVDRMEDEPYSYYREMKGKGINAHLFHYIHQCRQMNKPLSEEWLMYYICNPE